MNLLAFLTIQCRLDYLSDLRLTPKCKKVLSEIEYTTFPLGDWNEAIHYLCNINQSFDSVEQAKEYLLNYQ